MMIVCALVLMLIICLMIICLHDIVAHLFNSLIYLNLLPCYCFALLHGCCELASTLNVLTWRAMPDLQAVSQGPDSKHSEIPTTNEGQALFVKEANANDSR